MVKNQRIINILYELPIYPCSWNLKNVFNFNEGIYCNVLRNNKSKIIIIEPSGCNQFNVKIYSDPGLMSKKYYLIENIEPYDLVQEIDDFINGDWDY